MKVSMIEGAVSMKEFEEPKNEHLYGPEAMKDGIVIPYCTIGHRSGVYARKLIEKGYKDVRNGEGVIMWTHEAAGGLVNEEGEVVMKVHTYASPWDLASPEYQTYQFGLISWIKSHMRYFFPCC
mmetsp:Transcript_2362/g.3396  ORF Transcript_2362/g.3396 Transcript_2362/m.3396 type:complete len:124 (+) Transcript_2362:458-829(+)